MGTSTNPGDLAERVDIAIDDTVEPGDVMVVDKNSPDTYRRSNSSYEQSVAGIVSTNPTIVVGNGKTDYTAVMAMVGRVPVKVSTENGSIARGDLLITASTTGYAMKYDPAKDTNNKMVGIIGVALESFVPVIANPSQGEAIPTEDGSINNGIATSSRNGVTPRNDNVATGKVLALIRTGWIYNRDQAIGSLEDSVKQMVAAQGINLASSSAPGNLNISNTNGQLSYTGGNLDLQNNSIINVATIIGANNKWKIDADGNLIQKISTAQGDKEIFNVQSQSSEVVFSSSSQLMAGEAGIEFTELMKAMIDPDQPLKINVTLTSDGGSGVFVASKNASGFVVKELNNGKSNSTFDWIVVASKKSTQSPSRSERDPDSLSGPPDFSVVTSSITPSTTEPTASSTSGFAPAPVTSDQAVLEITSSTETVSSTL